MRTLPLVGAMIWICWRSAFMGMLLPTITLLGISCFLSSRFSSRNRLASIAFLIRIRTLSMERGFSKKSYAPNLVARTAVSMVPWPEIIMTSGAFSLSRIFPSVSRPSIPGSHTSSSTTSNACLPSSSNAASPLSASAVSSPSSSKRSLSDWRIVGSSSTMRILCMLVYGRRSNRFGDDWQLNYKSSADRLIFLHTNRSVMIFDNTVHNRKSQAGAAFLGREVGQEQTFFQLASHSVAGISDGNLNHIAVGHQRGRNLDLTKEGVLHGFRSVVHQIGQSALDCLAISHHVWQVGRERCAHPNLVQSLMKHRQRAFHDCIDVSRLRPRSREAGQ